MRPIASGNWIAQPLAMTRPCSEHAAKGVEAIADILSVLQVT